MAAYFLYLVLGVPRALWTRGLWLSENDVLHTALIAWMAYVAIAVGPRLRDSVQ